MTRDQINEKVQIRLDEVQSGSSSPISNNVVESIYSVIDSELDEAAFDVIRLAPDEVLYPLAETDKKFHHGQGVEDVDVRVIFNSDHSGIVVLPADFHKLVSFKMSDWTREIDKLHAFGGETYKLQKHRYTKGQYDIPVGIFKPFQAYITAEEEPYSIDHEYTTNQTLTALFNGETVGGYAISTDDILHLSDQTDDTENGVYQAKASGAPTLLNSTPTPILPGACIEFYSCKTSNATIAELSYIAKRKAELMPDSLIDPLTYICAARVFESLRDFNHAKSALEIGVGILNSQNKGVIA